MYFSQLWLNNLYVLERRIKHYDKYKIKFYLKNCIECFHEFFEVLPVI